MSFKEENFAVIKQAISQELASFCYAYFCNKRDVARFLMKEKWISPFDRSWGSWDDQQIPNTYSHYGDLVMETLLTRVQTVMEKFTDLQLIPTYSYARIYKYGDTLDRHKDRESCEISCTLNLGGDRWPIFLDPTGDMGNDGIKVDLDPGDILIYKGDLLEHWREPFEGRDCGQVFLHYNDSQGKFGQQNLYDGRPLLGLPSDFKK